MITTAAGVYAFKYTFHHLQRANFLILGLLFIMKQEVPRKKLVIFLVLSVLLITFTFYFYQMFFSANVLVGKTDRLVVIRQGTTFRSLQKQLHDEGVVNDVLSFSFVARLLNYDRLIKPGRYLLRGNMTNTAAVRTLRMGQREVVRLTFSHARTLDEVAEKITEPVGVTPDEFKAALDDFLEKNQEGFTRENIIAMFIPNTYEVYFNLTPADLVERLHDEYTSFWSEARRARADSIGLTPMEVSILASIVQSESAKASEAPVIAGLYINRLRNNIPLQADPTLIFATGDFTIKRVLNIHKEIDSPYNTYKYTGLPPGPVALPYISTLEAVLNFQQHDFLYMCAKEDFSGYHNFARTLREHERNASRYQSALSAEMRKARQKD